jgi:hypothetical protein
MEHTPEPGRWASLRRRWAAFMHYVQTDRPPPLIDPEPPGSLQHATPRTPDATQHRPHTP